MLNNFCESIENKIGYVFTNKELLLRAFTHSSFVNEHKDAQSYERLEFLGDAILGYVVGLYLYETFPMYSEGKLTKIRAGVVDRKTIASIIDDLDIMKFVRVGAGNAQANVLESVKIHCDIFEAIIGAIVIDCNDDLKEAKKFILRYLVPKIELGCNVDYKSRVWEQCAKSNKKPQIVLIEETFVDNKPYFVVGLNINGKEVARGEGTNKAVASQNACKIYLDKIKG